MPISQFEIARRGDCALSRRPAPQGRALDDRRAFEHEVARASGILPVRDRDRFQKAGDAIGSAWEGRREERERERERIADTVGYPIANEHPPPDPEAPSPLRQRCADACARAGLSMAEQHKLVGLCTVAQGRPGAQAFSEAVALAYMAAGDRARALGDPKAARADQLQACTRTSEVLGRFDELQGCVRALWLAAIDESPKEPEQAPPSAVVPVDALDDLAKRLDLL